MRSSHLVIKLLFFCLLFASFLPVKILYCSAERSEKAPNRPHWRTGQVNLTNGTEKLTEKKEVLRPTVTAKGLP